MKVVINKCFGGFGLSPKAVKRLAELQGRECYFFQRARDSSGRLDLYKHDRISIEEAKDLSWSAYDIPDPHAVLFRQRDWHSLSPEERIASNKAWDEHSLDARPSNRIHPDLVRVVEELGDEANGHFAELRVVEIPDGVDWEIDEYDGNESIHEVHRTWG